MAQLTLSDLLGAETPVQRPLRKEHTLRAYRADWAHFRTWCKSRGVSALPALPSTVAIYVDEISLIYKYSTITRHVSAISAAHKRANETSPTKSGEVHEAMTNARIMLGETKEHKAPIHAAQLKTKWKPVSLADARDKAVLLVGYAGGFKRCELISIMLPDISEDAEGLIIEVPRTNGTVITKTIHRSEHPDTCPVLALKIWLKAAEIKSGPVFRPIDRHGNVKPAALSDQSISLIIKKLAPAFGVQADHIGSHSLRSGLVTDLIRAGVDDEVIAKQTGHRDLLNLRDYKKQAMSFNYTKATGL